MIRVLVVGLTLGIAALAAVPGAGARGEAWRPLVAPESTCPGGSNVAAPAGRQLRTMLCLVNFARRKQRMRPLVMSSALSSASRAKAGDIARCGVFEHEACGKEPDATARATGYRGAWGENLFVATGRLAAPRVALAGWLDSPGHRRNLLRPGWRTIGIARRPGADLGRIHGGVVWVNQFGE
jgi:uncharacterized protein YkwD